MEAYFAWLKTIQPESITMEKTRTAIGYSLNQEKYLKAYLEDGEISIDNLASEWAIRPFCVGRANWHLMDTIQGAEASALVYSIVETAKADQLRPYEYLRHILTEMPKHIYDKDGSYLDDLLPWSVNLPDTCKKTT